MKMAALGLGAGHVELGSALQPHVSSPGLTLLPGDDISCGQAVLSPSLA